MKTLIIKQKMSNTGSIHDLASDCFDRIIKFRKGTKYAVVLAAYYSHNSYKTFKSEEAAIKHYEKTREYSRALLDCDGNEYDVHAGVINRTGNIFES